MKIYYFTYGELPVSPQQKLTIRYYPRILSVCGTRDVPFLSRIPQTLPHSSHSYYCTMQPSSLFAVVGLRTGGDGGTLSFRRHLRHASEPEPRGRIGEGNCTSGAGKRRTSAAGGGMVHNGVPCNGQHLFMRRLDREANRCGQPGCRISLHV